MGKCIVHCAQCGKAIREDDFSQRKAVAHENRTFCSDCRDIAPPTRRARKETTRRRLSSSTPRHPIPVPIAKKSALPLFVGGMILGFGIVLLIGIVAFRPQETTANRIDVGAAEPPSVASAPAPVRKPALETSAKIEAPMPAVAPPTQASSIRLTTPPHGARFQSPADISIEAEASCPNGPFRVEFYHGPIKLGETDVPPYRWVWKGIRYPGTYELMAKVVGAKGEATESPKVLVSVDREPLPVATGAPGAVSLSARVLTLLKPELVEPRNGSSFTAPATIPLSAAAAEDVERVEFFEGKNRLGEATRRPFSFVWTGAPAGIYEIAARAVRADGESAVSEIVSIVVRPPLAAPKLAPLPQGLDQRRVDEAIRRGVVFLRANGVKDDASTAETTELTLWTLVHAGVPDADPDLVRLLNVVLSRKLERTYAVALQAMILEELNRVRFQTRITQCAQFLVDAQCPNGQWSYVGPAQTGVPTTAVRADVATAKKPGGAEDLTGGRTKPKVTRKITIRKTQEGPATGDNSNSQYAALGLRACHDAGMVLPKAVLERGRRWWRDSQHAEEDPAGGAQPGVATGPGGSAATPAGWCYGGKDHGHKAYSSMTAGAVGSVAIYGYLLDDKNWKGDATLQRGLSWLDRHFTVSKNDGPPEFGVGPDWMLYYYLYALERAGLLCGTETFGAHRWYAEGGEAILAAQKPDGSWLGPLPHGDRTLTTNSIWDTCFAILFLRRATRPLEDVASTDERARR